MRNSRGEISGTHLYLEQQLGFLPPYVDQDLLLLGSQFCKSSNTIVGLETSICRDGERYISRLALAERLSFLSLPLSQIIIRGADD